MTAQHLLGSARSFLFVPGNRPDRFDKAATAGADVVVVDLEDAVAPTDKDDAREHLRVWLRVGNTAMVRINGRDTPGMSRISSWSRNAGRRPWWPRPKTPPNWAESPIWAAD